MQRSAHPEPTTTQKQERELIASLTANAPILMPDKYHEKRNRRKRREIVIMDLQEVSRRVVGLENGPKFCVYRKWTM
jgi:hypothetical protein